MENTMNTIKYLVSEYRLKLNKLYNDQETTNLIALVFNHHFGWNRADLSMNGDMIPGEGQFSMVKESLEKLSSGIPIQYITGETIFAGKTLMVAPGVLIPRPETEELVSLIINDNIQRQFTSIRILDIGTGSGCIAISLASAFRHSSVDALDISDEALRIASLNVKSCNVNVQLFNLDLLQREQMDTLPGYDIIVSNPPYVTESEKPAMHGNVIEHEPHSALFVPDDDPLRFYRPAAEFAYRHLVRPGLLYFEINERYGTDTRNMILKLGFERAEILRDMFGKERFIRAEAKSTMMDSSYWMVDKNLP
jgi:release factor glutamine methyltransferase